MDSSDSVRHRLQASFDRQSLMRTFEARLVVAEPGNVVIEAPIVPGARQQHGFAHAGLTFSLGDSAAGYAAFSLLPEGAEVLTAEAKINLLAPAQGDLLRATGRVIKAGRRLMVVAADVHAVKDGKDTLVAVLTATIVPLLSDPES